MPVQSRGPLGSGHKEDDHVRAGARLRSGPAPRLPAPRRTSLSVGLKKRVDLVKTATTPKSRHQVLHRRGSGAVRYAEPRQCSPGGRGETGNLWAPMEESVDYAAVRGQHEVLVMLGCRRCGALFFVCRKHYRGQSYCGDTCRAAARKRESAASGEKAARAQRPEEPATSTISARPAARLPHSAARPRDGSCFPGGATAAQSVAAAFLRPLPGRQLPYTPPDMRSLRLRVDLGAVGRCRLANPAAPGSSTSRPRASGSKRAFRGRARGALRSEHASGCPAVG